MVPSAQLMSRVALFPYAVLVGLTLTGFLFGCVNDDRTPKATLGTVIVPDRAASSAPPALASSVQSAPITPPGASTAASLRATDASADANSVHDAGNVHDACGSKGGPDCPLQAQMKTEMAPALAAKDRAALERQFLALAKNPPHEMENWASIARDGADAVRRANEPAIRAACRVCHEQYNAKYIATFRGRAL